MWITFVMSFKTFYLSDIVGMGSRLCAICFYADRYDVILWNNSDYQHLFFTFLFDTRLGYLSRCIILAICLECSAPGYSLCYPFYNSIFALCNANCLS